MSACYHTNQIQCDNCRPQRLIAPSPLPMYIPVQQTRQFDKNCQHCFCGETTVNSRPHRVCCMCQTRKLK